MPKRTDIQSILIIGAGPIVIGQACEFDYSGRAGVQGAEGRGLPGRPGQLEPGDDHDRSRAGRRHLYRADHAGDRRHDHRARAAATRCCRPWAGRPRSTPRWRCAKSACWPQLGVELIGANARRDRQGRGPPAVPRGDGAHRPRVARRAGWSPRMDEARGGARRRSACPRSSARPSRWAAPAAASPTTATSSSRSSPAACAPRRSAQVLIEESVLGWKEYEMEVVRDRADNCIIVCSIENVDPMGVHTGDCITVAPALTLTDKEYQIMRNASIAVLREIGVDTGGSNVQFAVNPGRRAHGHHRDEPARVALLGAGLEGDRLSRSPRSPPSSPSATRSTSSPTTSPASRRPRSSRPSTTSSPRCRASPSRNSRAPSRCSPRR